MALGAGQKNDESKTTLSEAFIQFQIQVKKKEIQEFRNETSLLEAKNKKLIELRDQLREKQHSHIRTLRKQAKEQERKLDQSERANKEQVEQALRRNVALRHHREEDLAELNGQLTSLETQVRRLQIQRQALLEYKTIGSVEHQRHIQGLQSVLTTMQKDFQERSESIQYSRDATFNEIDKKKSQMIDEQKQLATERVIKQLDKASRHEMMENDWLKRETAIYRKEVSILEAAVRNLEKKNLKHMNQLVEQRLSRLWISRNVFITQAADLGKVEQPMQKRTRSESTAEPESRPWLAHDSPTDAVEAGWAGVLEQEELTPSCEPSAPPCDLAMFPLGSRSDHRELLHLGPLEQKLLTVKGQAMTLYPMPSDPEGLGTSVPLDFLEMQDWALTTRSIRNKFH
ncbi:coiled-coil domain-containing protein 83 [Electrophorus electricus]|uniref:coiled-coil domain-containing protein 83 n=1 Tax=Electrophorus electricus TaxID=8005 RepID=UPI0015D0555D|nr:coiled-coil domain-containing protein 83 [Electrophorus electricus]